MSIDKLVLKNKCTELFMHMKYIIKESQYDFIKTIVEERKKDLSYHIREFLQSIIDDNKKDVCDVDVYQTGDGSLEGVIYFIGGPESKRWPTTQDIFVLRQNIITQMMNKIFNFFGIIVNLESKLVAKCKK